MLGTISKPQYWNKIFEEKPVEELSWYEDDPTPSLELIEEAQLGERDLILLVGAGRTTLVQKLLERGYKGLVATDISAVALAQLQQDVDHPNKHELRTVQDDLTAPLVLVELEPIRFWHDRATFHFLTAENDQQTYFHLLDSLLEEGGHGMIATFASDGPETCSGLPVARWRSEELMQALGPDYRLVRSFRHEEYTPKGDMRPFQYTYFQKQKH